MDWLAAGFAVTDTHLGPFMGGAPTGHRISFHGQMTARLREGLIVERWSSVDLLAGAARHGPGAGV